ncbi:MAG: DUF4349 domain-containing protein [Oscillospiraceae bacterium]|nr:DUF4349 domain-containing protein [Oscillospiraceae bacterium]
MKRLLKATAGLIFCLIILAACGAPSPAPAAPASPAASAPAPSAPAPSGPVDFAPAPPAEDSGQLTDSGNYFALPLLTPEDSDRRLVYEVSLHLQTTEFMPGLRTLLDTVTEMGGYIIRLDVDGHDLRRPNTERSAAFVFRVPSARLAEFIVAMENNYNIWRLHQLAEDVTVRQSRTDSALGNLIEQELRLREALDEAETLEDMVRLEEMLIDVQHTIDNMLASQAVIDDNVLYSTVNGQLFEAILPEEELPAPPFAQRLEQTVAGSVATFIAFAQGMLLVVIAALPVFLILAIMAAIVLVVVRLFKKYSARRTGNSEKKDE